MADAATSAGATRADGRRELGERTRQRLLVAARELLAERGEDAIRLRDVTDAAQVNVAAVTYHFGSVKALYHAAIREAIETIIEEQSRQLRELGDDATLEQIAAAWTRPTIALLNGPPSPERSFVLITARVSNDPPDELREWTASVTSRSRDELVAHLRHVLPAVAEDELSFRARCAAGIIKNLSTSNMRLELQGKTTDELERLLVPVITGALAAGAEA
jgi:AcrR family transcriptional regulator